jgi:hypothetical protein
MLGRSWSHVKTTACICLILRTLTYPFLPSWSIHVPSQHITMRLGLPLCRFVLIFPDSAILLVLHFPSQVWDGIDSYNKAGRMRPADALLVALNLGAGAED